jgi:hypothetical protein
MVISVGVTVFRSAFTAGAGAPTVPADSPRTVVGLPCASTGRASMADANRVSANTVIRRFMMPAPSCAARAPFSRRRSAA